MSYSHLSIIERSKLETLHRLGWTTHQIGCELGRHHATIAREIKRGKPMETRGRFMVGTPISKRPKEVRKRETFGHWELDTVIRLFNHRTRKSLGWKSAHEAFMDELSHLA